MKILIVDDNAADRRVLRYYLESRDATVLEAENGAIGLEVAEREQPDLIISDALMPEVDGFQFLRQASSSPTLCRTPFIFYSAVYTGAEDRELAMSLGANAFIVKPKEPEEFWEEVKQALDKTANNLRNKREQLIGEEIAFLQKYSAILAKKVEQKVDELGFSEDRFRDMVEKSPDWFWEVDRDANYTYVSPQIYDLLGYEPKEVLGKTPFDLMGPEEAARVHCYFDPFAAKNEPFFDLVNVNLHKDGRKVVLETAGSPIFSHDGEFQGYRGIDRDITERKRGEDELKAEQFRLSEIIRGTNVGTWEWNIQTGEVNFNERWAEIIGYTLEELSPISIETWLQYIHSGELQERSALLEKHFNGELDCYELECRMKHKDGRWVWGMTRGKVSSWTDAGKPLLMFGTHTDIDERRRLKEEQRTVEKLDTIGTLAGGIAHDFNNILAGLYGNISLARVRLTTDHPAFRFLDAVDKSMRRATLLTNQLLTFAKGGVPIKESLSLEKRVEEIVHFNLSGSNVKPVITMEENLWLANADQGQIQQVFANLTINARQAMPGGGHLYINMSNADNTKNSVPGLAGGRYVLITVADEGAGIPPEHLNRIFEPYFTTKQTGNGLGLATTYSIVKKHGGHISVASRRDKGATFTLYLPASESQKLPQPQIEIEPSIQRQSAKILVMDDEEDIRSTITAMLEELSFTVETAADGQQAMGLYQQALDSGDPFDLVILDLTVPGGLGGEETAKNILQIDSGARMLVSSGYADDPVMANYAEYGFKGVVTKPYNLSTLSSELAKLLER